MSLFKRVLVPVDFSSLSRLAMRYGCALAKLDHASITLLHVVQDLTPLSVGGGGIVASSAAGYIEEVENSAKEALKGVPEKLWAEGIAVHRRTVIGAPGEQIVDFARGNDVDLICIGTHGRGGFSRFVLGSVAERVVQRANCRVLVVRRRERDFVTDSSDLPTIRKILAPIDFSDTSHTAYTEAAELASRFSAELHLLHVVEDSSPAVSQVALAYPVFQSYVHELVKSGEEQLAKLPEPAAPQTQPVQKKVAVGTPVSVINDYADEHAIDLIVMGTHGRTGPAHWFLGSVAERVVRSAPCPVLVMPAAGKPQD